MVYLARWKRNVAQVAAIIWRRSRSHSRGQGFETPQLHNITSVSLSRSTWEAIRLDRLEVRGSVPRSGPRCSALELTGEIGVERFGLGVVGAGGAPDGLGEAIQVVDDVVAAAAVVGVDAGAAP